MTNLAEVRRLVAGGRFSDAQKALRRLPASVASQLEFQVLSAELMERSGQYQAAKAISQRLLVGSGLTRSQRSTCEFILGLIHWESGETDEAIRHFQRAVATAEAVGDLNRVCWAQLRLMVVLRDRSGITATRQLFATARSNVVKLGDPTVTAALHILLGELEAKHGLAHSSRRHTEIGLRLLADSQNIWLQAIAENNLAAAAIMLSDFSEGVLHAERAKALASDSGAAAMYRAAVGNLGNLFLLVGRVDEALALLNETTALFRASGEYSNGRLDSLARVHLSRGDVDLADSYLVEIEKTIRNPDDRMLYANRYALLTSTELLIRREQWSKAAATADELVKLAERASDRRLGALARFKQIEIFSQLKAPDKSLEVLRGLPQILRESSPEIHAHYERSVGYALKVSGQPELGYWHEDAADAILAVANEPYKVRTARGSTRGLGDSGRRARIKTLEPGRAVQAIAGLMLHAGRPELLATNLVSILETTGSAAGAVAVARDEHGREETLAGFGTKPTGDHLHTFTLGSARQRLVEVRARANADLESQATLNSIALLLQTVHDLERAQAEREERLTLWPSDELPLDDGTAVFHGEMQKLMSEARKFAPANISVLITGESGTGKEVIARAIHAHSKQAKRPFVPFNCTAVPRELLESQLFGHRRGAFTGADRDSPGLIRAAKDGTLFLDEIGELGLDLQPKLLRFLESGEIHPLGEPTPFTIDVRVIAATNADLEQLVQQGRFREDLFYRLNVIRLTIPPLRERRDEIPGLVHHFVARAAAEFGKRRVRVSEETMEHLVLHPWPGNVRQLQNEMRRIVALAEPDSVIPRSLLSNTIRQDAKPISRSSTTGELAVPLTDTLTSTLSRVEREMIKVALRANQGRVEAAAKALGISRKGLYLKRQRLGL